ncbi:Fusaric acid resistance protein family protein [Izhakiella capsodis]|uniref:Fusaric acid resistance protein family protein n=1 Tax=Izhakiella capsodis TaxID=1367852 RepID=A0A1I5AH54_9GAMM|nr:FUSC family protein [Izhakiella capsodis]SFN61767.1 Fusaric acid resistance protein family protein [Izhakiella capsodis]
MRPDKPISDFKLKVYRYHRVVHGVRIALAFVLTLMLVRLLNIPEGSWPLITVVVVMGPVSRWGNVFPRALQRIIGTIIGLISGLIALYLELFSLPVMLAWCAIVMFTCGFLTLGKHPYMALLIGITLAVVSGAAPGDIGRALWRGGDVIIGSVLALIYTSIWPARAHIQWRIGLSDILLETAKIYHAGFSPYLVERPYLKNPLQHLMASVVKMRSMLVPASKESRIPKSVFEGIQTLNRNMVCTLELQLNAWWSSRETHLMLLSAPTLRATQQQIESSLRTLSRSLLEGDTDKTVLTSEALAASSRELRELLSEQQINNHQQVAAYGYAWLSIEMAGQLERINDLVRLAMRK